MARSAPEQRIGLFGGAFNPVHLGHLLAARAAKEALRLDEVVFIPTGAPAFAKDMLPAKTRLRLLRRALQGEKGYSVDLREMERKGTSYTVDTLREMRAERGAKARLFFLLGADAALGLPKWKQAEKALRLAEFIVLQRPGLTRQEQSALRSICKSFNLNRLNIPQVEISSSAIRKDISLGKSIHWLVPHFDFV
jgi:nicotinate-nucleotide adenylyltransferase